MLPIVSCEYCGRTFKHQGYYIRHDRDSIISCATRLKIAEQDKIHREKLKKEYKDENPTDEVAKKRRWKKYYEKNKERILQNKKEYYQNNKDKFNDYYINKKLVSLGVLKKST